MLCGLSGYVRGNSLRVFHRGGRYQGAAALVNCERGLIGVSWTQPGMVVQNVLHEFHRRHAVIENLDALSEAGWYELRNGGK